MAAILIGEGDHLLDNFFLLTRAVDVAYLHHNVRFQNLVVQNLIKELTELAAVDLLHFYELLWSDDVAIGTQLG